MKQFKLLVTAGALLLVSSMQAQDDVTSMYLTNPSFEFSAAETTSTAQALTNGGSYYGWTAYHLLKKVPTITIAAGDGIAHPQPTQPSQQPFRVFLKVIIN